ncbi:MAG: hypothetical protein ACTHZX_10760 [Microbacterium sp.]
MSEDLAALNAQFVDAYATGGYTAAEPIARRILAAVGRWWLGGNAQAQSIRAQMRYTLARAALDRGDAAAAETEAAAGLKAAGAARQLRAPLIGLDEVLLRVTVAEIRAARGRAQEALDELDLAARIDDGAAHPQWHEGQVHLLLARQWSLQSLGRFDESERAAVQALETASAHEPDLVPAALERLSMIRRLSGSGDGDDHHLDAAAAIGRAQDLGAPQRGELARHLASRALETGDLDAAARHLDDAEREFLSLGDIRRASGAAVGRAEILRQRGDLDAAIAAAESARDQAAGIDDATGRIEALTVLGTALDAAGRSEEAVAAHDAARSVAEEAGDTLELIRIDVRRTVATYNQAVRLAQRGGSASAFGAATPAAHERVLARAADIAVPAALAADAIRFSLEPGPHRERWARQVSGPLGDTALRTLTALGRADEIAALLELIAASASLDPTPASADAPVGDGAAMPDRLDPPPRVRTSLGGAGALEEAIALAAERYGFAVRSDEVVDAW